MLRWSMRSCSTGTSLSRCAKGIQRWFTGLSVEGAALFICSFATGGANMAALSWSAFEPGFPFWFPGPPSTYTLRLHFGIPEQDRTPHQLVRNENFAVPEYAAR